MLDEARPAFPWRPNLISRSPRGKNCNRLECNRTVRAPRNQPRRGPSASPALLFAPGAPRRDASCGWRRRRAQAPSAGRRAPPPRAQGSPGPARPEAQQHPALQAQADACPAGPGHRVSCVRCAIRGLARTRPSCASPRPVSPRRADGPAPLAPAADGGAASWGPRPTVALRRAADRPGPGLRQARALVLSSVRDKEIPAGDNVGVAVVGVAVALCSRGGHAPARGRPPPPGAL